MSLPPPGPLKPRGEGERRRKEPLRGEGDREYVGERRRRTGERDREGEKGRGGDGGSLRMTISDVCREFMHSTRDSGAPWLSDTSRRVGRRSCASRPCRLARGGRTRWPLCPCSAPLRVSNSKHPAADEGLPANATTKGPLTDGKDGQINLDDLAIRSKDLVQVALVYILRNALHDHDTVAWRLGAVDGRPGRARDGWPSWRPRARRGQGAGSSSRGTRHRDVSVISSRRRRERLRRA